MGWATKHIEDLKAGKTVSFRPSGRSMEPRVKHRALVTVVPASSLDVEKGDIVLCTVRGREYLHLVKAKRGDHCLIGNNKGGTNGWTRAVYGLVVNIA